MIKILLADDEQVERIALKKIIDQGLPDAQVIGQAANGREAIQLAEQLKPDLILMDIQMPGINGLDAIQQIKEEMPQTKYIIVSAYDMFEYARQGIRLGIQDYLLKPSRPSTIVDTVRKVVNEIEQERKLDEERKSQQDRMQKLMPVVEADFVTQLLFDHVHEVHLDEMMQFLGCNEQHRCCAMVLFAHAKLVNGELERQEAERIYRTVKAKIHEIAQGWVGAMTGHQLPVLFLIDQQLSFRSQLSIITRKVLNLSNMFPDSEFFVGIGNPYESLNDIKHSYHEALLASMDMTLSSRHRFYEDLPDRQAEHNQFMLDIEKAVIEEVRLGNEEGMRHLFMRMIDAFETGGLSLIESQQRVLEMLLIASRMVQEIGVHAEKPIFSFQVASFKQLRMETDCLLGKFIQVMNAMKQNVEPDVIYKIKQYIIDHAHKDISLEMIAEHVRLSPFYISKIFKEQIGVNYIDFLTECRINKAKAMIIDGTYSLKEIAYDVGYKDPNYFSRVFKKICGVSPTDYRKMANSKQKITDIAKK